MLERRTKEKNKSSSPHLIHAFHHLHISHSLNISPGIRYGNCMSHHYVSGGASYDIARAVPTAILPASRKLATLIVRREGKKRSGAAVETRGGGYSRERDIVVYILYRIKRLLHFPSVLAASIARCTKYMKRQHDRVNCAGGFSCRGL